MTSRNYSFAFEKGTRFTPKDKLAVANMTYNFSINDVNITGVIEIGKCAQVLDSTSSGGHFLDEQLFIPLGQFLLPITLYRRDALANIRLEVDQKSNLLNPTLKVVWKPNGRAVKEEGAKLISQFQQQSFQVTSVGSGDKSGESGDKSIVMSINGKHPVHAILAYLPTDYLVKRIRFSFTVRGWSGYREWILPQPTSRHTTKHNQFCYQEIIKYVTHIPEIVNLIIGYLEPFFSDMELKTNAYFLDLLPNSEDTSDADEQPRKEISSADYVDCGQCFNFTYCTSAALKFDYNGKPDAKNGDKNEEKEFNISISILTLNVFRWKDSLYGLGWM